MASSAPWADIARGELEAGRDADAVMRWPACRFFALRCPIQPGTPDHLELVNAERSKNGLEPLTSTG